MKKVCLVYPRFRYKSGDPPIGLCSIASHLRKRCNADVSIIDATFNPSWQYIKEKIDAYKPDIVGVYIATMMFDDAITLAALARESGALVVAGGPHATIAPESLINHFDIVVRGEGEEAFAEIVENSDSIEDADIQGIMYHADGKIKTTRARDHFIDLDSLDFPAFDLVDVKTYMNYWHYFDALSPRSQGMNLMASRGCAFQCSFCQPTLRKLFGDRVRFKSPQYVIRELQSYMDLFNVRHFFFHDDTFAADRPWMLSFLRELEGANMHILWGCNMRISRADDELLSLMYERGLRCMHIGIESASQKILDDVYQKQTTIGNAQAMIRSAKKNNIHIGGFFMIGAPDETREDMHHTIRLAVSSGLDEASFSIVNPLPGTYLYDTMMSNGMRVSQRNYSQFDYYRRVDHMGSMGRKLQLMYLQKKALFLFYVHPARLPYLLRHLLSVNGIKKLYAKIRRFL